MPYTKNAKKIKQFLGLLSCYQKFILNFAYSLILKDLTTSRIKEALLKLDKSEVSETDVLYCTTITLHAK